MYGVCLVPLPPPPPNKCFVIIFPFLVSRKVKITDRDSSRRNTDCFRGSLGSPRYGCELQDDTEQQDTMWIRSWYLAPLYRFILRLVIQVRVYLLAWR